METMIAVLVHPRKSYSLQKCLDALMPLRNDKTKLYLNIQFDWGKWDTEFLGDAVGDYFDEWAWDSSVQAQPKYSQDPARLAPIVIGRNMALNAARNLGAKSLLFVDSDVIVPPNTLEVLKSLDSQLCGGVVPGRGAHSEARYVFGLRYTAERAGHPIVVCNHGTMGMCLIGDKILNSPAQFRYGLSFGYWVKIKRSKPFTNAAEDPLFAEDVEMMGITKGWTIATDLIAEHLDDPNDPLTEQSAAPTYITT